MNKDRISEIVEKYGRLKPADNLSEITRGMLEKVREQRGIKPGEKATADSEAITHDEGPDF